jgi:hypothetical protein
MAASSSAEPIAAVLAAGPSSSSARAACCALTPYSCMICAARASTATAASVDAVAEASADFTRFTSEIAWSAPGAVFASSVTPTTI